LKNNTSLNPHFSPRMVGVPQQGPTTLRLRRASLPPTQLRDKFISSRRLPAPRLWQAGLSAKSSD